jgi:hypothetical protein
MAERVGFPAEHFLYPGNVPASSLEQFNHLIPSHCLSPATTSIDSHHLHIPPSLLYGFSRILAIHPPSHNVILARE